MRLAVDPVPKRSRLKWLLHVLAWIAFILYEQGIVYYTSHRFNPPVQFVIYNSLNILLFYSHIFLLKHTIGHTRQQWLKATLLSFLEIMIIVALKGLANYFLSSSTLSLEGLQQFAVLDFARSVYFAGLATIIWAVAHLAAYHTQMMESELFQMAASRDMAILKGDLATAENAYLQQQLHPHLLFNTLNFIYNSVYQHSRQGADAVMLLAEIMRYSLDGTDRDGLVDIGKEMEQLNNLIQLNRCRFDYPLHMHTLLQGDLDNCRIIPLILLTLSENMFKHGNLKDPARPATLTITREPNAHLTISTFNYKKHQSKHQRISQIGISNLRKRLMYAYADRHDLQIENADLTYRLQLTITL